MLWLTKKQPGAAKAKQARSARITQQHARNQHETHSFSKLVIADHWDGSDPLSLFMYSNLCACEGHVHRPPSGHTSASMQAKDTHHRASTGCLF
jgi:hypothetical protein